jgi:hypothetical protein
MTYQDFATRRALLGVAGTGRPQKVSDQQHQAIWASWCAHTGLSHAQRFLKVTQETKLDLRTIWPVLRPAWGVQQARESKRASANRRVMPQPQLHRSTYRRAAETEASEIYQQP